MKREELRMPATGSCTRARSRRSAGASSLSSTRKGQRETHAACRRPSCTLPSRSRLFAFGSQSPRTGCTSHHTPPGAPAGSGEGTARTAGAAASRKAPRGRLEKEVALRKLPGEDEHAVVAGIERGEERGSRRDASLVLRGNRHERTGGEPFQRHHARPPGREVGELVRIAGWSLRRAGRRRHRGHVCAEQCEGRRVAGSELVLMHLNARYSCSRQRSARFAVPKSYVVVRSKPDRTVRSKPEKLWIGKKGAGARRESMQRTPCRCGG